MPQDVAPDDAQELLKQTIGYLNFSDGAGATTTLVALNRLYSIAAAGAPLTGAPPWLRIYNWLAEGCDQLEGSSAAFADLTRARRAVHLTIEELLPAYLDFHRDLLFHQHAERLFNGFFLARAFDAVLQLEQHWPDAEALRSQAIRRLNDYVGYRPVPVLEGRNLEPYAHEWVRPIPIYVAGAGFAEDNYNEIASRALAILEKTDAEILREAHFNLDKLDELAIDPRAYDFDHPVAKRPNHQFGCWDPHSIDGDGFYRRFVIQQVTLDALLKRVEEEKELNRQEVMEEAAAVLAGTMLMASGISGEGPTAHPSTVTLASLLAPIAAYRDAFYDDVLSRMSGPHAERLREECRTRKQPLGAARQHLNAELASRRATQLQHVQLARLYARMGYPDAAQRQADEVSVPSARLVCRIDCELIRGIRGLRRGQLQQAAEIPKHILNIVHRGIDCGAIVDPWNILGFAGNFARFTGPDSAIRDHRIDDLIAIMEQTFGFMARVWSEAAARDDTEVFQRVQKQFYDAAQWWRKYAAHTVESLDAVDPIDSYESAQLVAEALRLWHRGGAATADIRFWAPHADLFDSPRAYSLVIDALLERNDFVTSQSLLMHWLSSVGRIGLRRGDSALHHVIQQWMTRLRHVSRRPQGESAPAKPWTLITKFFECLEANADELWRAPQFQLARAERPTARDWDQAVEEAESATPPGEDVDESGDESTGTFDAAYEDVVYRDSTDDGVQGSISDGQNFQEDTSSEDELQRESERLADRLDLLAAFARVWTVAADLRHLIEAEHADEEQLAHRKAQRETIAGWARDAAGCRQGLLELLDDVRAYRIPTGGADGESMTQYDSRRLMRDSLIERIIATAVEVSDARRMLVGVLGADSESDVADAIAEEMNDDDRQAVRIFSALIAGDRATIESQFSHLVTALQDKPLLYIPTARGGDPVKIFAARLRQRVLSHLLIWLPRRGHFRQACQLIETARQMEQNNPVGPGAVTEFDRLFEVGFRATVEALVEASHQWEGCEGQRNRPKLIGLLEELTETMLGSWLAHSRTLRLSALETVAGRESWEALVRFIKEYGDPIFTQEFLRLRNIRAVLHQGTGGWLRRLQEQPGGLADSALVRDLGQSLDVDTAEKYISIVFETILDHHSEYQDYNSTTTQSDRGDLLYTFLEFIALVVRYDRIAWNLRPVLWAHEQLLRGRLGPTAAYWRRSLSERISSEADDFVAHLRKLQNKYAMRMPTVADRILERFVQPMTIDRMRALVEPAMQDAENDQESDSFFLLQQEANLLTQHPLGVGLDLPAWLAGLDDEVMRVQRSGDSDQIDPKSILTIPRTTPPYEEIEQQLKAARLQGKRLPYFRS